MHHAKAGSDRLDDREHYPTAPLLSGGVSGAGL
jgi:hypothetical protein